MTHREKVIARLNTLLSKCPTQSQRDMVNNQIESKCTPGDKDCIAAQGITSVPVLASRNADGTIKKFFPLAGPSTAVSLKKAAPYIEVIQERLAEEFPGETMDEARQDMQR